MATQGVTGVAMKDLNAAEITVIKDALQSQIDNYNRFINNNKLSEHVKNAYRDLKKTAMATLGKME